jgi:CubicO group peptidase (beta-lactamase class C family)
VLLLACGFHSAAAENINPGAPASVPLNMLDPIVQDAVRNEQTPGAVLLVWHDGAVVYRKAFGNRSLEPRREAMTVDTIFDIASLTKVVATTTAVMQLEEQGKIRINDPVAKYLPEFAQNGKEDITIRELLTHHSGLPESLDLVEHWQGSEAALRMAFAEKPIYPAGARFLYSDVDFIVLGALVERVSGMPLNDYCEKNIFAPLQMTHTRYLPPASWLPQIAPTQFDEHDTMLRGVVHDPTARRMGGVAGHAGGVPAHRRACTFSARDRKDDDTATTAHVERLARIRLGHGFAVFQQSR